MSSESGIDLKILKNATLTTINDPVPIGEAAAMMGFRNMRSFYNWIARHPEVVRRYGWTRSQGAVIDRSTIPLIKQIIWRAQEDSPWANAGRPPSKSKPTRLQNGMVAHLIKMANN